MAILCQILLVFIATGLNTVSAKKTLISFSENVASAKAKNISKLNILELFSSFLNKNISYINSLINPTTSPITSSTTAIPPKNNDQIILIDCADGLEFDQHDRLLNFTAQLASVRRSFPINGVGVYMFGFNTYKIFNISQSYAMTAEKIRETVLAARYYGGTRRTHNALRMAIEEFEGFFLMSRSILVVTTDRSQDPLLTQLYADIAPKYGIRVVAAGISNKDEQLDKELEMITGGVKSQIFRSEEFEDISNLLGLASRILCW